MDFLELLGFAVFLWLLVVTLLELFNKGEDRQVRMSDEDHVKDEVRAVLDKGDLDAFDRLVEKYDHEQVLSALKDALQETREQVRNGLALSYICYKRGWVPEEQCESTLKDAYGQLDDKSDLIPSLNMLSDEQGASYYKRVFLKFLEKDKISL